MHVQISASKPGPLSILEELPSARLAVLEGLNGIGKTLAVRVLQVCTGTFPYRLNSLAWESMCKGLGDLRVTVTDLNGAREIIWLADTREWLKVKATDETVPFRQITVDGKPVTSTDSIKPLLVVHRLAGDEGITETLAQEVDSQVLIVRRWIARYANQESSPLARLEQALGDAAAALGDVSPDRHTQMRHQVQSEQEEAVEASEEAARHVKRRDSLAEAVSLRRRLDEVKKYIPNLETELSAIDTEIEDIQAKRDAIQTELMELAGQVAGSDALVRELRNARRTRDRNRQRLSDEIDTIAAEAADLNIDPTLAAVESIITELNGLEESLNLQQLAVYTAPEMRNLLDKLSGQLGNAEDAGLSNEVAIKDSNSDTQLTVSQTRAGMLMRRAELEGQPPSPQAKEVAERLADVETAS